MIELFTGNVSILCTSCQKGDAIASAQMEVTKVYNWRQKWKLNLKNLKADKSEVCQFYMWSNESKQFSSFTISGSAIRVNNTPPLLGVILDRSLLFNADVRHIKHLLSSNLREIGVTTHTSWVRLKPLL